MEQAASKAPKKKYFRARAHSNPFNDQSFHVPQSPSTIDWSPHYPVTVLETGGRVTFADVGCGFGGLLVSLSPLFPGKLMLGMELRDKVTHYVSERIKALRQAHPGQFENISVVRGNAQRHLVNYFAKGQLEKLFFLFPVLKHVQDPHFKATNHRRRIIQTPLLAEYAYCMAVGGLLYAITDVPELGEWMQARLEEHPLFERLSDAETDADPAAKLLSSATEEGRKVARNGGETWQCIYRRLPDSAGP